MAASRKRTLIPPTVQRADWRDASSYPPSRSTSSQRWGWEFLRRNQAYCADFERLQRAEASRSTDALVCDPPARRGETYPHYYQRMRKANERESVQRLRSVLAAKWMVTDIADPNDRDAIGKDAGWGRFRIEASVLRYLLPPERAAELKREAFPDELLSRFARSKQTVTWRPRHNFEVAVMIDVRLPIGDQLSLLKDLVSDLEKRWLQGERKRRRFDYVKALQLLDAYAEGAPIGEFAEKLGYQKEAGMTRSLKRDLEAAYRYCELYDWVASRKSVKRNAR